MIIGSFNVFLQVMLLTSGGPNGRTSVLQYMLYDRAFGKFQFGQASAVGLISSITIVILTLVLNKTLKLDEEEN
jgi:multiple sugar transport system permease protein